MAVNSARYCFVCNIINSTLCAHWIYLDYLLLKQSFVGLYTKRYCTFFAQFSASNVLQDLVAYDLFFQTYYLFFQPFYIFFQPYYVFFFFLFQHNCPFFQPYCLSFLLPFSLITFSFNFITLFDALRLTGKPPWFYTFF